MWRPFHSYLFGTMAVCSAIVHAILFASAASVPERGDIIFAKRFDDRGNAIVKMHVTTPYTVEIAGYSTEFQAVPTFDGFEIQFYTKPFPKKAFITVTNQ